MGKLFIGLAIFAGLAAAQCTPPSWAGGRWSTTYTKTGTASAITFQHPGNSSNLQVFPQCIYVYCELACTVTFSQDGTAATTTALTVNSLGGSTPQVKAYRDSNAGSGTAISPAMNQAAASGSTYVIGKVLDVNLTSNNLTVTVAMSSGVIQVLAMGYQNQ